MKKIILVGGGGHCRSCIDVIEQQNLYQIQGIIDNNLSKKSAILGYKIIGQDDDLVDIVKDIPNAMVTIGQIKDPMPRINLFYKLKSLNYILPTIISPRAYIARSVQLEEGACIMHNTVINSNVVIGKNSIVNTKALIEHDVVIGNFCHVSTSAVVNGASIVKDKVFIGSHATVINNVSVDEGTFISAGKVYKEKSYG